MSDIEIEIDGKICPAKSDAMVIQVADEAGIYIPRFCYHKHLSIAANCRMCLVEVEKMPKPLPACATPVTPGMKVFTKSSKALAAQKAVMEFLLINHPLDCPICDQGGECELQDLSLGFGSDHSRYREGKRSIADENLGPLIETEMTRCIYCTRCVRFGKEIAGLSELGVTFRGENSEIGTYIEHAIRSEVSGNVIDLCPVGALTSKPFRFTARAWELSQRPTIAAHDCLGSALNIHTRVGKVMRAVPRENEKINQTWISDRDRFSYQGLNHTDRLSMPLIRIDGGWKEVDWQTAFDFAIGKLQKTLSTFGVEKLGALASPNSTLEEFYLLQKLVRALGSNHIDHRLRQVDFNDQDQAELFPGLNSTLPELEEADAVVLIGSMIQKEQPIASVRLRRAILKGAPVIAINMIDYQFHFSITEKEIVPPQEFVLALARLAKALGYDGKELQSIEVNNTAKQMASHLRNKKNVKILLGTAAHNHFQAAQLRSLAYKIAELTQGTVGYLTEGCNTAGAWIAGALPHRSAAGVDASSTGFDVQAMLCDALKAYILLNVEPDLDSANPVMFGHALRQADCIIALSSFKNTMIDQLAHVIFPIAPFTETSGTFVNASGTWQSFMGAATPLGETRPGWKVLRVMGNWLQLAGFDYESSEEVRDEVKILLERSEGSLSKNTQPAAIQPIQENKETTLYRIGEIPMYSGDAIVRRASALQETQLIIEGNFESVRLHPKTAETLQVRENEEVIVEQREMRIHLPVLLDERIPLNAVLIAGGLPATSGLSELFGPIHILKC